MHKNILSVPAGFSDSQAAGCSAKKLRLTTTSFDAALCAIIEWSQRLLVNSERL